ncbi:MAG TPA: glycosyltransferase family 4 protein [Thermodesulfobacteriota bacterium]|nr:glycosyltransferase family 4 protein [Thermodesulfobacteriota bacterium]
MKKVLFLSSDMFFKGGLQRYARYEYKALREIMGEENVFSFSLNGKDGNSFEEEVSVNFVPRGGGVLRKIDFTLQAIKFMRQKKIDLLIINLVNLSSIGLLAKSVLGINYIVNVYGFETWGFLNSFRKISLKYADKIIGDCNFILNYCKGALGVDKDKIFLLHDCVDVDRFKPAPKNVQLMEKHGIPESKFIILTVGRVDDGYKGHELVIRALKELPEHIVYVIVGGGRLVSYLKSLVKDMNLESRVTFTGRVKEEELVDFYRMADLFVLVTRLGKYEGEGLPLTPIEAAACGKPILVGDEDGSVDAVEEGKNGFIVSPRNLDELVERIKLLYRDENLRLRMGNYGREKVKRDFAYEKYKETLKDILGVSE